MKKMIFILSVLLIVLLVVWLVIRFNRPDARDVAPEYKASNRDEEIVIYDMGDLVVRAQEIIPSGGFGYIYGGAETEKTMHRNITAFDAVDIYPRVLTGVVEPNIKTSILGIDISFPVIVAPAAAHGLAHISAEAGTAYGAAVAGTIMSVSTYAHRY